MASESIRVNEGGLSKKNGGGQAPQKVCTQLSGLLGTSSAENHNMHRDVQENDKGKSFGGQYFVSMSALVISLTSF